MTPGFLMISEIRMAIYGDIQVECKASSRTTNILRLSREGRTYFPAACPYFRPADGAREILVPSSLSLRGAPIASESVCNRPPIVAITFLHWNSFGHDPRIGRRAVAQLHFFLIVFMSCRPCGSSWPSRVIRPSDAAPAFPSMTLDWNQVYTSPRKLKPFSR